jgi:hypothetical protein
MPLDLSTLTPSEQSAYLRIGKRHVRALLQADATLQALEQHAPALVDHGFATDDAQVLADARALRISAGVGRTEKAGERTLSCKAYEAARDEGLAARLQARSILGSVLTVLRSQGEEESVLALEVVLGQTRKATKDAEKLAIQLDLLAAALAETKTAKVAKSRGGPAAKIRLGNAAPALRGAQKARQGKGTVYSTEQIHVINGIIVTLARQANAAARAAARAQKTPALAQAFSLKPLYGKKSSAKGKDENAMAVPPAEVPASEHPAPEG